MGPLTQAALDAVIERIKPGPPRSITAAAVREVLVGAINALDAEKSPISRYVDTRDFGAIADGGDHPLSERYATLAAAQAVYPRATSLAQSIDAMAIQKAIDTVGAAGGGTVRYGGGDHVSNALSTIYIQHDHITIDGCGLQHIATNYTFPVFMLGSFTDPAVRADHITFERVPVLQTQTLANPPNVIWYPSTGITDNHVASAIHHGMGDNLRVLGCSFENFIHGVSYVGQWNNFAAQGDRLEIDGCNFDGNCMGVLIWGAIRDLFFTRFRNRNTANVLQFSDDGLPDPPHAIYGTGGDKFSALNENAVIGPGIDYTNLASGGSVVKLKSFKNFVVSDIVYSAATSCVEVLNCSDGIISNCRVADLAEDALNTVSQAAYLFSGSRNITFDGCAATLTGAGTQAFAGQAIPKNQFAIVPAKDVPCEDIQIIDADIDWNPVTGTDTPLSPFYIDATLGIKIFRPTLRRIASLDTVMFNIQNNNADNPTRDVQIVMPMIDADAADPHRHKLAFVESGVTNTRFIISDELLHNIDPTTANFISNSGTGTIIRRLATTALDGTLAVSRAGTPAAFTSTADVTSAVALQLDTLRPTAFANDAVGVAMRAKNGSGALVEIARMNARISVLTAGVEDGQWIWRLRAAGTLTDFLTLTKVALTPTTNDVLTLGTGSLGWADLYLASGGRIYVNNVGVLGPQGAAVADATDAASAITQLNALLARLRTHGLIAT